MTTKTKIKLKVGEIYPLEPQNFGLKINIGEVEIYASRKRTRTDYEIVHTIYNQFSTPHIAEARAQFTAFGFCKLFNQNAICNN